MTSPLPPASTAAEESRRLANIFEALSIGQRCTLAAARECDGKDWYTILLHAHAMWGRPKKCGYRTMRVLVARGLVERRPVAPDLPPPRLDGFHLTVDGRWVEGCVRQWMREKSVAATLGSSP